MTLKDFEALVAAALDDVPEQFAKAMDNVEVIVEIWPTAEEMSAGHVSAGSTLFGLYRGIPKTQRGNYSGVLPDIIIIFAGPLVAFFGHDPEVLRREVRKTVFHEIGHHFGMSDEQIRAIGL